MSKMQNTIKQAQFITENGITFVTELSDKFLSYFDCYSRASAIAEQFIHDESKYLIIIQDQNDDYLPMIWAGILSGKKVVPMNVDTIESMRELHNVWLFLDKPTIALSVNMKKVICGIIFFENEPFFTMKSKGKLSNDDFVVEMDENDIALIMFSSGTTGEPKGVELTSGNIFHAVKSIVNHYRLNSNDIFINWMSLTHAIGLNIFHFVPLFLNANQVLINPMSFVSSPTIWMSKTSHYRATITCSANFGFCMASQNALSDNLDLSCVRVIIAAGEPISSYIIKDFYSKYVKYGLSNNSIKNLYGMTESVLGITATSCDKPITDVYINKNRLSVGDEVEYISSNQATANGCAYSSSGIALDCVTVRLVDDNDNILEDGKVGHIQICGKNVTSGYHKIDNSGYFTTDMWLRTGDIGFIESIDNSLVIVGREKDVIIVNGRNYFCSDLERMISQIEGINSGDVAIASIFKGEEEREIPILFIKESLFSDSKSYNEIMRKIKRTISINSGIRIERIVPVETIPTTSAGKIKRRILVEKYIKKRGI